MLADFPFLGPAVPTPRPKAAPTPTLRLRFGTRSRCPRKIFYFLLRNLFFSSLNFRSFIFYQGFFFSSLNFRRFLAPMPGDPRQEKKKRSPTRKHRRQESAASIHGGTYNGTAKKTQRYFSVFFWNFLLFSSFPPKNLDIWLCLCVFFSPRIQGPMGPQPHSGTYGAGPSPWLSFRGPRGARKGPPEAPKLPTIQTLLQGGILTPASGSPCFQVIPNSPLNTKSSHGGHFGIAW